MVIGNGMVAKKFSRYQKVNDVIIFASGVSNSKLIVEREFERELILLEKITEENRDKRLVYFSTFNLYDPAECNSAYCRHKLRMEEYLAQKVPVYHIFRLGHVAAHSAKQYTILSFLYNAIKNGTPFKLWRYASRNIIDIDDIVTICSFIIDNNLFLNQITNICNSRNTSISEIVKIIEDITGKKAVYTLVDEGGTPEVDNSKISWIASDLKISFDDTYTRRVVLKYYS